MKKTGVTILMLLLLTGYTSARQKTTQERLGYSRATKLQIVDLNDIGVSHSENSATIAAMEKRMVNSGSIITLLNV